MLKVKNTIKIKNKDIFIIYKKRIYYSYGKKYS